MRDKVRQERLFRNNADLGRNLSEAKQNEVGYKNQAYMSLGGATAPQLVQTGGTQSGQTSGTAYTPLLGSLLGGFSGALGSGAGGALAA